MLRSYLNLTQKLAFTALFCLIVFCLGGEKPDTAPPRPRPRQTGGTGAVKKKAEIDLSTAVAVLKTEKGTMSIKNEGFSFNQRKKKPLSVWKFR